jgi:hypothetical protein
MKAHMHRSIVTVVLLMISVIAMSFANAESNHNANRSSIEGEITSSVESNGNIGANFYLNNSSSRTIRVSYKVENSRNVELRDTGGNGTCDIAAGSRVLVVQAIVTGSGDWYSGDINYSW